MRSVSFVIMGLSSILMQITALRRLLSVFSGNELDIGITLSIWLIAAGAGSYAGGRIKFNDAYPLSFLAISILAQPTIFFIELIRSLISAEFGEALPLTITAVSTIVSLFPICFIIGAQFPLAVSFSEGKTAKVYGLEAAGAFTGGMLLTFIISGRVDAHVLTAGISILNILTAFLLSRKRLLIAALLVPVLFHFGISSIVTTIRWGGAEVIERHESRYGEIVVLKIRDQLNVYSSGKLQFSYPDFQTEELRAHVALQMHDSPERILMIGGSPAVLRELLKYPVSEIDFVEIDPKFAQVSLGLMSRNDPAALNDKRLKIMTLDARRFIKTARESRYDLIVLNLPEPSTANINRFYTVEFFKEAKNALRTNGVIFFTLPTSYGYVGRGMQATHGAVYNSLKSVFRNVAVSSEEYGVMIGSDAHIDTDPVMLGKRFLRRKISARYFHPYILDDAFSPARTVTMKARLEKAGAINTDSRPAAYLFNLMTWAEMQKGKMLQLVLLHGGALGLFIAIAVAGAGVFFWGKKAAAYYSIYTTGCTGMAFSIILVLAFQALFGYVYETIGILTALFMAGIAAGAYGVRIPINPIKRLRIFGAAAVILLPASAVYLKSEPLFYILSFLIGAITGAEFTAANQFIKERDPVITAGRLYGLELGGAFLGALLTTIFFVPVFGIQKTILIVVLFKTISLVLLFSIRYEKI